MVFGIWFGVVAFCGLGLGGLLLEWNLNLVDCEFGFDLRCLFSILTSCDLGFDFV